jgi:hypothetical protein
MARHRDGRGRFARRRDVASTRRVDDAGVHTFAADELAHGAATLVADLLAGKRTYPETRLMMSLILTDAERRRMLAVSHG